ncbi:MAG TPA: undecaprenyl-diphosphate phosphatase [Candidatus Acidoferrales bacterium]|nr:undecaprenyl-diphosphate phosphatase [Candidatus Acidoferrales bacterium]
MPLYQAFILAIVQALTEFLPVSSSAHLVLFPWLAGWPEPGLAFDVALHAGTVLAVVLYFLRTWLELILSGLGFRYPASAPLEQVQQNRRMFWYLVAGTIPGGIAGLLFEHAIEEHLRKPIPIGLALIAVALLMWLAESTARLERGINQTRLGDSLLIGTAQALALFPGVSRSGITIAAGLWRGMKRETAARFSFLLSTPIIAGAATKELPKLLRLHHAGGLDLPLSTLAISIATSAVAGYLVIAFFLRYLQTRTLKIFIVYRILFGIVVLLLAFLQLGHAR